MREGVGPIRQDGRSIDPAVRADRHLYTATLRVIERDGSCFELFHCCRAGSLAEAAAGLAARVGREMAAASTMRSGIQVDDPVVVALLGTVVAARLASDGDLEGSALLHSGDLHIVQRRG